MEYLRKNFPICFLRLIIILSYIFAGKGFPINAFAGESIWDISYTYQKQYVAGLPIGKGSTIPYEFFLTVSGEIKMIGPSGSSSEINISNINSSEFSQIFALHEVGEYQVEETYILNISSPVLGEQSFIRKDARSYYNSEPRLIEFRLEKETMYFDIYMYKAFPEDTIDISISPLIIQPDNIIDITITTLRPIKKDETFLISIYMNSKWYKTSFITPLSNQGILYLKPGWNLMSFLVSKCFYEGASPDQPSCVQKVDIKSLGFSSLAEWFNSAIVPNGAWQMVIGTDGAMDSSLPHDFHSLKYMSSCLGYWVKIKEDIDAAALLISGQLFDSKCAIKLQKGWNLVSFPINKGYYDTDSHPALSWITDWQKVDPPVVKHVFNSIVGKYSMLIGTGGAYSSNLPTNFSSLRYIAGGYGYWIKMNEAMDLIYP